MHPSRYDYPWEVAVVTYVPSIADKCCLDPLIVVFLSGIFRYLGICITDLLFTWTCQHRPSTIVGTIKNVLTPGP